MNPTPQAPELYSWQELQGVLTNSFDARATGILGREFTVEKRGVELGRLKMEGLRGAEFEAAGLKARIERMPGNEYRMFSGGEHPVLSAGPKAFSADILEIACTNKVYTSRISFLRNTAIVRGPAGGETSRLTGSFAGRRYEVNTVGDASAIPISVLLLYHTAALRRRVYQA